MLIFIAFFCLLYPISHFLFLFRKFRNFNQPRKTSKPQARERKSEAVQAEVAQAGAVPVEVSAMIVATQAEVQNPLFNRIPVLDLRILEVLGEVHPEKEQTSEELERAV